MSTIQTTDRHALQVFRSAFPDTKFRKLHVSPFKGPMSLNSYWDSGYRDYFVVVEITTGKTLANVQQNGTPYDARNLELSELPSGFALAVRHYAGTRQYGTLYLNPADITPMLPAPVEVAQPALEAAA
jgi:hypothetical protein